MTYVCVRVKRCFVFVFGPRMTQLVKRELVEETQKNKIVIGF